MNGTTSLVHNRREDESKYWRASDPANILSSLQTYEPLGEKGEPY